MDLQKISEFKYLIPKTGNMRVLAVVYTSLKLLPFLNKDIALSQLINVVKLPGSVNYALGMPDMHQRYAFSIGGVAAFDLEEGAVSPGGVCFDINCGVRAIKTNLKYDEAKDCLEELTKLVVRTKPLLVVKG
jgi:tRNA-splicing ligase RtcB